MSERLSVAELHEARRRADRVRAEWLIGIADGILAPVDLIDQAIQDGFDSPLRRITLRQLLLAQEGWGRLRARVTLDRTKRLLGESSLEDRRMTVGWLIGQQYDGRHLLAFADAFDPNADSPWIGFPYAPAPEAVR